MNRRVLVVMPTLGRRLSTMRLAVESATAQSVPIHLVVVVPQDASDARRLAETVGATIVDDPGTGLSGAVNAGLAASEGETWFAWLNDDDYFLKDGLAHLLSLAERSPQAVVAYGGCRYISESGKRIGSSRAGLMARRILAWGPDLIPQPASLMRLSEVVEVGGYDESLRCAMDLDMFLRLRSRGNFVASRDEVATFRWHPDSISVVDRSSAVTEAQMVKRRQLSPVVRWASPIWDHPVAWATSLAGRQVSRRASRCEARAGA